jgi:haloalkane dehalogenase
MRMMRSPGCGWLMISVANIFLKKMLPDLTYAQMSPDALAYYRSAFPTVASRRAVRQWPLELPLDGIPAHNAAVVEA